VSAGGRASPLREAHVERGARLTEFAGWDMPLHYVGIVAEHNAVRSSAGVFDVSHLGKLLVSGPKASAAIAATVSAAVAELEPGRARYGLVLAEDGGCIDDVFVYRMANDAWLVVPNAANVDAVRGALEASGGRVEDQWDRWAILALQGPESFEVMERAWPGSGAPELKLHRFRETPGLGRGSFVARTGYTGERGFELYVDAAHSRRAWDRVVESGAVPVGLGARDTLRLEMGYALYGHELTRAINPLEAGLEWAISWDDTTWRGRDALLRVRETGPAHGSFGIVCRARGVPRAGYRVHSHAGLVGEVTSGNHSPTLGTGIALARGPRAKIPPPGTAVFVEARGRRIEGAIVQPPFVERGARKSDK
jgi:glycine cleavage system T protein (aminomethyltransferase)